MSKNLYLPTARNYYPIGTPVKQCFEGRVTKGKLEDADSDKNLIALKTADGKKHWSHASFVTLDR